MKYKEQLTAVEKQLPVLRAERDKALASEAMHRQAVHEQAMKYKEQLAALEEQLAVLRAERDKALTSEARHEQAVHEQELKYKEQLTALRKQLSVLKGRRDKTIIDAAMRKHAFDEEQVQYKEQVAALEKQLAELRTELEAAKNYRYSLEKWKKEKEEEMSTLKKELEVLPESFHRMQSLFTSKAYRLVRLMKMFRSEVLGFRSKQMAKFSANIVKYLMGTRGVFNYLLDKDPLFWHLEELNKIIIKANKLLPPTTLSAPLESLSASSSKIFVPELRRSIIFPRKNKPKRVAYLTNMLLDWIDHRPRFGGGERYCLTITNLLKDLGLEVDLYQVAPEPFEEVYYGHKVKALKLGGGYSEFVHGAAKEFYEISLNYDHVIYNMPELTSGPMRLDAISICHGIWFDHENYGAFAKYRQPEWYRCLYRVFDNPRVMVSVDCNTINVIRSLWPHLAEKIRYIPNFYAPENFYPPQTARKNSPLKVLFPRRGNINRGSRILGDILRRVPHQVEFYWVGEGDDQDTNILLNLSKQDRRLQYTCADFEEMPGWYRKADICVIPTIACEGTSFSCIEALASGCATIATNIGGLVDLIQDSVNGLLVSPTPEAIAKAINNLIENPDERRRLQAMGPKSAEAFAYPKWRQKWEKILLSEGWIEPPEPALTVKSRIPAEKDNPRTIIVTRNGYHGGVETMVKLGSIGLSAPVIVTGGLNDPKRTCPFSYTYVKTYEELLKLLKEFDVVFYHWPLEWAVQAIKDSGLPSVEYVHRTDTDDCDKSVPNLTLAHTEHIVSHLKSKFGVRSRLVPYPVDLESFKPDEQKKGTFIGAITSYFDIKGVDIFLKAWAKLASKYPEIPVVFYGLGGDLLRYQQMARELGIQVDFRGPLANPEKFYQDFRLIVSAARQEGGMPLAALEALATNVPVVASDLAGCVEFNRMAKEKGFEEPLLLFKSEDVGDLAAKLDQALQNDKTPHYRQVVEKLLNPEAHVRTLDEILRRVYKSGSGRSKIEWELLDDCLNTGTRLGETGDEGFFLINSEGALGPASQGFLQEGSYPLVTRHNSFLCYSYSPPQGTDRVSCFLNCSTEIPGFISLQFDWYRRNNSGEKKLIKMSSCYPRLLDNCTKDGYLTMECPPDADKLVINIRPGKGHVIQLNRIRIQSWKRK